MVAEYKIATIDNLGAGDYYNIIIVGCRKKERNSQILKKRVRFMFQNLNYYFKNTHYLIFLEIFLCCMISIYYFFYFSNIFISPISDLSTFQKI